MDIVESKKRAFFGKQFGELLKKWESQYHKTQKDFCQEAGVSKNIVKAWKDGDRFPRDAQMIKICETLGVDRRVFYPVLPFEEDRVTNSLTEDRSRQLQQYATTKGLKEDFYQFIIQKPDFLRKFPIHRRDWFFANSLLEDNTEEGRFALVKYQFEDDAGHRFMLSEEDIDFLIRVQEKTETQIDFLMYRERQKIDQKFVEHWVDIHLKHLRIDREEVLRRLYAVDVTQNDRRISEKMIGDVVLQIADEQGVRPQYTKADIVQMFVPSEAEKDNEKLFIKASRIHGATEEQIRQTKLRAEEWQRDAIKKTIEDFRKKGFLIEDDNTETEG